MEKNLARSHNLPRCFLIVLAMVLIAYPLSVGPLAMLGKATGNSAEFYRAIDPYFVPLRKLPPPVRGLLARWARLWRGEPPNQ